MNETGTELGTQLNFSDNNTKQQTETLFETNKDENIWILNVVFNAELNGNLHFSRFLQN